MIDDILLFDDDFFSKNRKQNKCKTSAFLFFIHILHLYDQSMNTVLIIFYSTKKNVFCYVSNNSQFIISSMNESLTHICCRSNMNKIFTD